MWYRGAGDNLNLCPNSCALTSWLCDFRNKSLTLSVPREHNDFIFCGIVERIKLNASVNETGAAWHIAGSQNIMFRMKWGSKDIL